MGTGEQSQQKLADAAKLSSGSNNFAPEPVRRSWQRQVSSRRRTRDGVVRGFLRNVWRSLQQFPTLYFWLAIAFEAGAALFVGRSGRLEVSLMQFMLGAQEIVDTHRISSTFLPVGYPALVGWAEVAVRSHPVASIIATQIATLLLIFVLSRTILLQYGSPCFATTAALLACLHPQLLVGVKRILDTNVTVVLLLAAYLALLKLRARLSWPYAVLAGAALACAGVVRPNLLLLTLALLWSVRGAEWRTAVRLGLVCLGSIAATYCLITTAVHGKPFFPGNGPYNLYAGYNPHSKEFLLRELNAEDSILPAMADKGFKAGLDWARPSDLPGVNDVRDRRYAPYYSAMAASFIRKNPGEDVDLAATKLAVFFRQSYANKLGGDARSHSMTVVFKQGALLVFPAWFALMGYSVWKRRAIENGLFLWTAFLYMAPFVLINSDPRFRIPLECVVLLDIARMLYVLRLKVDDRAGQTFAEADGELPGKARGTDPQDHPVAA